MNTNLIQIIKDYSFLGSVITFENLDSQFIIKDSANQKDIEKCNEYFEFKLPEDYLKILTKANGFILFKIEDFAGFKFLGCNELIKENRFQKENYEEDWDNQIILFCQCLGDAEYLGLRVFDDKSYEILDCEIIELPSKWQTIGTSIDDFIESLLQKKGRKFWLVD